MPTEPSSFPPSYGDHEYYIPEHLPPQNTYRNAYPERSEFLQEFPPAIHEYYPPESPQLDFPPSAQHYEEKTNFKLYIGIIAIILVALISGIIALIYLPGSQQSAHNPSSDSNLAHDHHDHHNHHNHHNPSQSTITDPAKTLSFHNFNCTKITTNDFTAVGLPPAKLGSVHDQSCSYLNSLGQEVIQISFDPETSVESYQNMMSKIWGGTNHVSAVHKVKINGHPGFAFDARLTNGDTQTGVSHVVITSTVGAQGYIEFSAQRSGLSKKFIALATRVVQ